MGLLAALLILAQDVDGLIAKLGDDDPKARDEATIELRRLGPKALDALRTAAKSEDGEIAGRARFLIAEIDFPEPGTAVNGLAVAVKAEKEYAFGKTVMLRGRIVNLSDHDIVLAGADVRSRCEDDAILLDFDRSAGLHTCFHHPGFYHPELGPDIEARIVIKKGQFIEFTFSPEFWCAYLEHSKCSAVQVEGGHHKLALTLNIARASEGEWTGAAKSNEVEFDDVVK